jgi:superfamily II DNA or RNA helicase
MSVVLRKDGEYAHIIDDIMREALFGGNDLKDMKVTKVYYDELANGNILVPRALALKHGYPRVTPVAADKPDLPIKLFDYQPELVRQAAEKIVESNGVLLQFPPGTGKTCMGLYLASLFTAKKTPDDPESQIAVLIPVGMKILGPQWAKQIIDFYPEEYRSLVKSMIYMNCVDVDSFSEGFCMHPNNAKFLIFYPEGRAVDLFNENQQIFKHVKVLIVDECHKLCTSTGIKAMLTFTPEIIIACSATPARKDGADAIMDMFVGEGKVTVEKRRDFKFCKVNMKLTFNDIKYSKTIKEGHSRRGSGNDTEGNKVLAEYGSMCRTIATSQESVKRMIDLIVKLVVDMNRKVLCICDTVEQCRLLGEGCVARGITADSYTGDDSEYDGFANVLFGTPQKVSTGFDQQNSGIAFDQKFNALIMAQTVANNARLTQSIGRVFRAPKEVVPLVLWPSFSTVHTETFTKQFGEALSDARALGAKLMAFTLPEWKDMIIDEDGELFPPELLEQKNKAKEYDRINYPERFTHTSEKKKGKKSNPPVFNFPALNISPPSFGPLGGSTFQPPVFSAPAASSAPPLGTTFQPPVFNAPASSAPPLGTTFQPPAFSAPASSAPAAPVQSTIQTPGIFTPGGVVKLSQQPIAQVVDPVADQFASFRLPPQDPASIPQRPVQAPPQPQRAFGDYLNQANQASTQQFPPFMQPFGKK